MDCVAREAPSSLGLAWVVLASLDIVLEMSEKPTNLPTGDVGHILSICAQAGGEEGQLLPVPSDGLGALGLSTARQQVLLKYLKDRLATHIDYLQQHLLLPRYLTKLRHAGLSRDTSSPRLGWLLATGPASDHHDLRTKALLSSHTLKSQSQPPVGSAAEGALGSLVG